MTSPSRLLPPAEQTPGLRISQQQPVLRERDMVQADLVPWPRLTITLAATSALCIGLGMVLRWPQLLIGATGISAASAVAAAWWGSRVNVRRRMAADLSNQLTNLLRAPARVTRTGRWRGGMPNTIAIAYSHGIAAAHGPQIKTQLAIAAGRATGQEFTVHRLSPGRRVAVLRSRPDVDEDATTPLETAQQKITDIAVETFGAGTKVSDFVADGSGDDVISFCVHYASGPKMTVLAIRDRMVRALTSRLAGRWRTRVDLERDLLHVERAPELPTKIDRPTGPVSDEYALRIPLGVDEDGHTHLWDMSGVMAHMLLAGRTRTGKTVVLIGATVELSRRHMQVFIIDPKRIEFLGLRDWPNVSLVATKIEDQIALIIHLHDLMMERYRQIEEDGVSEASFERVFLLLDEYRIFYSQVQAWWTAHKVSGMPTQCPVLELLGALLRMSAAARIHVALGTQRPDADVLEGEMRDNFSLRAATGRLSGDGSKMMFGSTDAGSRVPRSIQGRGTMVGLDDRPRELQYFYTPDPRKAHTGEDLALLDALRPAEVTWGRMMIVYPTDDEAKELVAASAVKISVPWTKVGHARLVPWDPEQGESEILAETTDGTIVDDGYGVEELVQAGQIHEGDLVGLDDDDVLVTITSIERRGATVTIQWRDDDDHHGEHEVPADEAFNTRRPL